MVERGIGLECSISGIGRWIAINRIYGVWVCFGFYSPREDGKVDGSGRNCGLGKTEANSTTLTRGLMISCEPPLANCT